MEQQNMLHLSASPHIHSGKSTAGIMRDVLIALAPAAVAGTVIFGLRSLLVMLVTGAIGASFWIVIFPGTVAQSSAL